MRKIILSAIVIFQFTSCNQSEHGTHDSKEHKHSHGDANHHMHKTPFEELVKNFESKERDEWQKPELVINFLGDLKNKTIIDIGAGTGYIEFKINEPSVKMIAADVDDRFIDYMNKRIESEKAINITTRKAEYDVPPVSEKEADIVFMIDVYHHIENRVGYFQLVKKGLKDNGSLVIVDFKKGDFEHGPPNEMKLHQNEVIAEMKKAGLNLVVQDTTSLEYQYLLKFN
jgi:cyclopropane fatty-acyl-phospholipid synthase-like methyltransferase